MKENIGIRFDWSQYPCRTFRKGQFIFTEGEFPKEVYLIKSGRVKIGSNSQDGYIILSTINNPGDVFGECAALLNQMRLNFAQAMDDLTEVYVAPYLDFESAITTSIDVGRECLELLGTKIRKTEKRIEFLTTRDARSRIILFLIDLAGDRGLQTGNLIRVKNQMTHRDVSSLTGTSRQMVTTVFNDLMRQGLVKINRKLIEIHHMEGLKSLLSSPEKTM